MNTLRLTPYVTGYSDGSEVTGCELYIDGLDVPGDLCVYLDEIARSIIEEGENFAIFGCGCGVPECCYVAQRVRVRHSENSVIWTLRLPIAYWTPSFDADKGLDVAFNEWERNAQDQVYEFERSSLVAELNDALIWLLENTKTDGDVAFLPHGTERADLERLVGSLS